MVVGMLIVLFAAIGISLVSSLLYRLLINQNDVKQLKNEMKYQKERANKAKKEGDKGVESEASKELMSLSGKQMKFTMKPLMFTMVFVIFILGWLSTTYAELIVALPLNLPFIGNQINWFFWYIFASIPSTFFFRKMFGVE